MRFIFIVQGEGRGHLTQAIAMSQLLQKAGHQVIKVLVGTAEERNLAQFFTQHFLENQITTFRSPCLVYHKEKLSLTKTIFKTFQKLPLYLKSIKQIKSEIQQNEVDCIINFYDILAGFHQYIYRPKTPMLCVGHQYLFLHQDFQFPKGFLHRFAVNFNSRLTALGSNLKLALSFRAMPLANHPQLKVVPPLIRKEFRDAVQTSSEGFLLAYTTHPVLAKQLIEWHQKNQATVIHCFSSNPFISNSANLVFHQIDGTKFFEMMKRCTALVCTAGFESVCEAMYLQKPVMMIPVPHHYEQACNALDAELSGAGIQANSFLELSNFIKYLNNKSYSQTHFKPWVNQADDAFLSLIEGVCGKS